MRGTTNPYDAARRTADDLIARLGAHDLTIVLGSGWSGVAEALGDVIAECRLEDLPGVEAVTVSGHLGLARSVEVPTGAGPARVLVLAGRVHLYEGHDAHRVVHLARAAVLHGSSTVALTNAAGSLRPACPIGSTVLVSDQLNLTGRNPMTGEHPPASYPSRFVDLSDLYDADLRAALCRERPDLVEGVYAGLLGGSFETPAEIRMLDRLGADLVGMSTVLEAIAARHLGARVVGLSLVTNLAAGLQSTVDHLEVLDAGRASTPALVDVLRTVVQISQP